MIQFLEKIVHQLDKAVIVIDALDECAELAVQEEESNQKYETRRVFISQVLSLSAQVLVTSRNYQSICKLLHEPATLKISPDLNDIRQYILWRIEDEEHGSSSLREFVAEDRSLEEDIIKTVIEKYSKIFNLARLQMDHIHGLNSPGKIRDALNELPMTESDFYALALKRIKEECDRKYGNKPDSAIEVFHILAWVLRAKYPLKVSEMLHSIAAVPGCSSLTFKSYLCQESDLIDPCAGLIIIEQKSRELVFAHPTIRDYLDEFCSRGGFGFDVERYIAQTCLLYLSLDSFDGGSSMNKEAVFERMRQRMWDWPFLYYAACQWGEHLRGYPEELLRDLAVCFLGQSKKLSCSLEIRESEWILEGKNNEPFTAVELNPVVIASSFGLMHIVEGLLKAGVDINVGDGGDKKKSAPVVAALAYRHEAMALFLIEKGADLEATGLVRGDESTALHLAADRGSEATVRLLLERGADLEATVGDRLTALRIAACRGHEATVRLLLEKGADLEARDNNGKTALIGATQQGCEAMVRLLLEKGADIGAADNDGKTALIWGTQHGHEATVRLLLEKGADLEARDDAGCTSLLFLASYHAEVLGQLLIEEGADLEARNNVGYTTLLSAAYFNNEAFVELLIEEGADLEARGEFGRTALQFAALHGLETIVRSLVEEGADLEARDNRGNTALLSAAYSGKEAIVQFLLEEGANLEVKNNIGRTGLLVAAKSGNEAIVQSLLEKEADLETRDNEGYTALLLATESEHGAVVSLLLEKGADTEALTHNGLTALMLAYQEKRQDIAALLLENGANRSQGDTDQLTVLELAAEHEADDPSVLLFEEDATWDNNLAEVRRLLLQGAMVDMKGSDGNTALIVAIKKGYEAISRLLLEYGADVEAKDGYGYTALDYAEIYDKSNASRWILQDARKGKQIANGQEARIVEVDD